MVNHHLFGTLRFADGGRTDVYLEGLASMADMGVLAGAACTGVGVGDGMVAGAVATGIVIGCGKTGAAGVGLAGAVATGGAPATTGGFTGATG